MQPEPIAGSLAGQNMPVLTCLKTQQQTLLCSGLFLPSPPFGCGQGVVVIWDWTVLEAASGRGRAVRTARLISETTEAMLLLLL